MREPLRHVLKFLVSSANATKISCKLLDNLRIHAVVPLQSSYIAVLNEYIFQLRNY